MKVHQALKEKKKLVSGITQITELIKSNNSIQAENKFEFDINELLQQRKQKVNELIALKLRLAKTSVKIQPLIFKLSELKQELKMFREMDTQQAMVTHNYSDLQVNKKVQLSKADVLKKIDALTAQIDEVQNKIDEFNYETELLR